MNAKMQRLDGMHAFIPWQYIERRVRRQWRRTRQADPPELSYVLSDFDPEHDRWLVCAAGTGALVAIVSAGGSVVLIDEEATP